MKIIEIRRHSIRSRTSDHLSPEGIALARMVGQGIGPFERVVTSKVPRAYETAIAMGLIVDEQVELMNTYGSIVEREAPWPMSFAEYQTTFKQGRRAWEYARKLARFYEGVLDSMADGKSALAVNHGGVVELGVVGCLPDFGYSSWGGAVEYCEGARLYWDGRFIRAEELRVSLNNLKE